MFSLDGHTYTYDDLKRTIAELDILHKKNWVLIFDARERVRDSSYIIKDSRMCHSETILKRARVLNFEGEVVEPYRSVLKYYAKNNGFNIVLAKLG